MPKVKNSLRAKLTKQFGKLIKKHGAEFAIGLATGIVTDILVSNTQTPASKKKKSTGKKTANKGVKKAKAGNKKKK